MCHHSFVDSEQRCAPASVRLVDNEQFQLGKAAFPSVFEQRVSFSFPCFKKQQYTTGKKDAVFAEMATWYQYLQYSLSTGHFTV